MDPADWPQVERVFAHAVELPPEDRAAYVATACAGHPELLAEVLALLASDADARVSLRRAITHRRQLP